MHSTNLQCIVYVDVWRDRAAIAWIRGSKQCVACWGHMQSWKGGSKG